ncbi:MAG: outer membrane beta-barrel protein [Prevotella sp.]|nr:outer membrane beta-barrel protein [Prevotella sp.]
MINDNHNQYRKVNDCHYARRKWQLTGVLFIICYLLFSVSARAQDDPEYRMEIGGGAGVMTYQGDFNGSLLKNMQPTAGAVVKYKLNPRMDWAANIGYGKLKGSSKDANTWYPELAENPIEFSTSVIDVTVCFEYNFWPFGTGREYLGARPLTPFIAIGAGFTIAKPDIGDQAGGIQFPVGAGVKYKLKDRLNLAVEWLMHFTGSDKLDGVEDPYGIKSTGLFKNTDCYSTLRVTLTYDFWARCKTCHNDRD